MQAILTRYHGATDYKPSRVSATASGGRVMLSYDYDCDLRMMHKKAALALVEKMNWNMGVVGGTLPNQDMAWVLVSQ